MTKLIKLFTFSLLLACCLPAAAQTTISGTVTDNKTGERIGYVNIGIVGTTVGTVSGQAGNYSLKIPEEHFPGTLRFSYIGYEDYDISVSEFLEKGVFDIALVPRHYDIEAIRVSPKDYKIKVLGNTRFSSMIQSGPSIESRGYEIGVVIKNKKNVFLEKCTLHIQKCTSPEAIFRLNIYKVDETGGFENILTDAVYGYCYFSEKPKVIEIDLTPFNIVADGDFMVALQHIDENEGIIYMPSSLRGSKSMVRKASQGEWEKFPITFPISVTARVEK